MTIWQAQHFHDTGQLILLVLAGEDGVPRMQFGENAAQTPHINGHVVVHAENHFWRAVKAALDIRVHFFILETARAKINHPNLAFPWMHQQNVFRLQVAVHDACLPHERKTCQHLLRKPPNKQCTEPVKVVGLNELVQIDAQQLHRDTQMLPERERVRHVHHTLLLLGITAREMLHDLHFDHGLVMEAALVADQLDGDVLPRLVVTALQDLPKAAAT